jgi:large subunit ribosomal protein L15
MSLSLSNLKSIKANKRRKRVGRGNASGHGTYSTRGLKGQKSRSGVSGLKRLGMKKQMLSIPKKRGFTSYQPKAQPVTLAQLNKHFKDGSQITPRILLHTNLISTVKNRIKILAQGTLIVKNLKIQGVLFSASAREQIEKNGGVIS